MECVVEMRNIRKEFPGIVANDDITLELRKGEVHALLGENGAGKSTLMSILFGLYKPDAGQIMIRGKETRIDNPNIANELGIGMVHQHFKLVPSLTVYENILLGAEITQKKGGMKTPFIDQKEEIKRVEKLIQENHLELNAQQKAVL